MKRFTSSLLSIIALLLWVTTPSFAQKIKWETATSNGFTYRYLENDPAHARFYTLDNGLTVVLSVNKKEPRIQTYVAVKAGSKTDPANHTGLAHYLEHMLFKGTDKFGTSDYKKEAAYLDKIEKLYEEYNQEKDEAKRKEIYKSIDKTSGMAAKIAIANEYDKIMSALGGVGTNAFTSYEQTVYIENIPSNVVPQFLDLQAERFRNPVLRIFHTELEAVYEEKNRSLDNDDWKAYELMYERLFPNSYGRQTTIGTIEHLKNPSLKAIKQYYDDFYVPNNMGIIMVGDLNPDEVIKMIADKFGYMQAKEIPAYTFTPEVPLTSVVRETVVGPDAPFLMMAYRFDGVSSENTHYLPLIAELLSNGTAGLFDVNLVQKQKVLDIDVEADMMKDYSAFVIYATPTAGQKLEDLEKLIVAEIQNLKNGNFPDHLIESVANNTKVEMIDAFSKSGSIANMLMSTFTTEQDYGQYLTNLARLGKHEKKDIMNFVAQHFNNNYVVVYKKTGVDANAQKVDKPSITPVEVNRDAQSDFLVELMNQKRKDIQPAFVNPSDVIETLEADQFPFLYVRNKENDLFSIQYIFDYGAYHSKTIDLATEYIQLLGTKTKTSEQINAELYQLASTFNIYVGDRKTYIIIKGLSENYDKTMQIVGDLLTNAVIDKVAFKGLVQNEIQDRLNNKNNKSVILQGMRKYAEYGKDNPFNYVLSDKELKKLKPETLLAEIQSLLSYPRTITFYGNTEPDIAVDNSVKYFPKHATLNAIPAAQQFTRVKVDQSEVLFTHFNMVQAEVFWVNNGPTFTPELLGQAALFNEYFGGNMSSIVFQTIRESKALAYSTYFRYNTPAQEKDAFSSLAYVGTQADKFHDAVNAMNDLLKELPMSDIGLNNAKSSLVNFTASQRIQPEDVASFFLRAKELGFDYDYRALIFETASGSGKDQVLEFYNKYIAGQPYIYCVVASDKKITTQDLEKYGKVRKLSLKEIFGY